MPTINSLGSSLASANFLVSGFTETLPALQYLAECYTLFNYLVLQVRSGRINPKFARRVTLYRQRRVTPSRSAPDVF